MLFSLLERLLVTNRFQGSSGLTVGSRLISFAARSLPLPELVYDAPQGLDTKKSKKHLASASVIRRPDQNRASWNLENVGFIAPADKRKDVVTIYVLGLTGCFKGFNPKYVEDPGTATRLEHCLEDFISQLQGHNFDAWSGDPFEQELPTLTAQLKEWFETSPPGDCGLILLEEKSFSNYATIKRYMDLDVGRVSVCAVGSKITDRDGSSVKKGPRYQVLSNLALKLNMKRGGDNHWLQSSELDGLLGANRRKTTMICGGDVTHPGAGSKLGCPSIACIVGSVDENFMNYPGSMRLQAGQQEVCMIPHRLDSTNLL
jgi:hypothetical protein